MKSTHISIIAVMLVVIAVAIAGCSSSQPATTGSPTPAAAGAGSAATPAPASTSASSSGSQLFGGLSYDWVEYKMVGSGTGADQMIAYYKYNQKAGTCTMRFEGAAAEAMKGMATEMDCGSTGGTSSSNPNDVKSDVQFVKVGTEVVTVPAGTFTADKYTSTFQGTTSTYWIVSGKPLIKMQGGDSTGSVVMELNGMG